MSSRPTPNEGDQSFLIATGNQGKRREFEKLLASFLLPEWKVYDRNNFPRPLDDVEETGQTFRENAILKAMESADQSGCCALADDSGLEVDALGGAPGVRSARFAGDGATDEENNELLLARLDEVPDDERTARFVVVVCLALPSNAVARQLLARRGRTRDEIDAAAPRREAKLVSVGDQILVWFRGELEGKITTSPAGDQGFGYDPYFFVPQWDKTMAEVSMDKKNKISHRATAVRKLIDFFE